MYKTGEQKTKKKKKEKKKKKKKNNNKSKEIKHKNGEVEKLKKPRVP